MRKYLNISQLSIAYLFFFVLGLFPIAEAETNTRRPNIILILADDLGYGSLGCYGNTRIKTPHIDRLALNGIRLTDFHSNGPMCTPTRAALLTGRYQQRCAWVDDSELSPAFQEQRKKNVKQRWAWGISLDEITIADVMKQAGYRTALFGKWHLGYDFKFHPMDQGFDEFRGFIGGAVDYHTHIAESGLKELDWWENKEIKNDEGYTTDLLTKYATDFISKNKDTPFFLYLSHESPHTPLQGRDPSVKKTPANTYKEMIEILDESVGSIVTELRNHHLEENTLLIFCSDNGPQVNFFTASGPLRGRKGSMYEGGHRVPCIASWPSKIPLGQTSDHQVMTMDFFPTFVKLSGTATAKEIHSDGIDLMPLLKGEPIVHDRVLHWLFDKSWAVRKGAWKLIGKGNKPTNLVNLANDLSEKTNHIDGEPKIVAELLALHQTWITEVGNR